MVPFENGTILPTIINYFQTKCKHLLSVFTIIFILLLIIENVWYYHYF